MVCRDLFVCVIVGVAGSLRAQRITPPSTVQHDTAYYSSYAARRLTFRFYFSQKYTTLTLYDRKDQLTLRYQPNTTLNMGVGASYKWATLNLAYGWGFLNQEDEK